MKATGVVPSLAGGNLWWEASSETRMLHIKHNTVIECMCQLECVCVCGQEYEVSLSAGVFNRGSVAPWWSVTALQGVRYMILC